MTTYLTGYTSLGFSLILYSSGFDTVGFVVEENVTNNLNVELIRLRSESNACPIRDKKKIQITLKVEDFILKNEELR